MSQHCAYCCAHPGKIVVAVEHTSPTIPHTSPASECRGCYEQYGPCPFCDRGRELEASGHYGADGFWRGIMPRPADVPETCRCHSRPLSREASKQQVEALTARLTAYLSDTSPRKTRAQPPLVSDVVARAPSTVAIDDDEIGTLL